MHILIIGGGIIGLMSALELSQAGCHVTVLDQQDMGQAASWAGGGILSTMYPWRYHKAVNALARHGKTLYQQWQPLLQAETGLDIEIHHTGMLILDPEEISTGLAWAQIDNDQQQAAEHLDHTALQKLSPQLNNTFQEGVWFPQLANVRNPRLLQTLIAFLAKQPNVKLVPHTQAELVLHDERVQAVKDQYGKLWQADAYVLASGAWSGLLSQQLAQPLPVKPIQGQMTLFKTPANWLSSMVMYKGMYLLPRKDGHIVCGSSMEDVGFDTSVNSDINHRIQQFVFDTVPALKAMPIVKAWAGLRPAAPQGIPYIGKAEDVDNLWLNTGHFRNGLVMAPASARMLRELMLEQTLSVAADAYSVFREPKKSNDHEITF